tara:strand:+ start:723 stop:1196 length:474 start_codon:yes stop_codon:yes gene_type:complete
MAKASLGKGRDNHKLNGQNLQGVKFEGVDIFKSYGRLRKYGPYDILVCDPPSFQKGSVNIEEAGGGAVLESFNILTASEGNSTNDTGNLLGAINLSAFENQTVRLNFVWDIPQQFTGPAFFQLDNIRSSTSVPEPSTLAIFALGLMGLASRRFKKQA